MGRVLPWSQFLNIKCITGNSNSLFGYAGNLLVTDCYHSVFTHGFAALAPRNQNFPVNSLFNREFERRRVSSRLYPPPLLSNKGPNGSFIFRAGAQMAVRTHAINILCSIHSTVPNSIPRSSSTIHTTANEMSLTSSSQSGR
jgi:hypothetical protein